MKNTILFTLLVFISLQAYSTDIDQIEFDSELSESIQESFNEASLDPQILKAFEGEKDVYEIPNTLYPLDRRLTQQRNRYENAKSSTFTIGVSSVLLVGVSALIFATAPVNSEGQKTLAFEPAMTMLTAAAVGIGGGLYTLFGLLPQESRFKSEFISYYEDNYSPYFNK